MKQPSIIKRAALFAALLLSGSLCHAAGWTPSLTVGSAFTENSDLIVIYTSDGGSYTSGCSVNAWIFTGDSDARRGRVYATIMTAIATGKKIRFWYTDTCAQWGYHESMSVMLVN